MKLPIPNSSSPTIAEMEELLERLNPPSASAALQVLQNAFPAAPIKIRVDACQLYARCFLRSMLH